MAKGYDEVVRIKAPLEDEYQERHEAHRRLRNFWHGRYWEDFEKDSSSISSIFRDLTNRSSDIGPDIKLVYNTLKDVCVKFQTYLAPLPMIRCYVDPPSTPTRRNQATKRERYLYGMWSANNMNKVLADQGWYLPLMGDAFLGIYPDLDKNLCRTLLRSPETAYPLPCYDNQSTDGFIFCWKAKQSAVMRYNPDYVPKTDTKGRYPMTRKRKARAADPDVEILEYSDKYEFSRFAEDQRLVGVDHNFGYDLFDHVKFINVPGEVWGHGAVEQAVNLVEMGNAYLSLMMQSAIENVFPVMVIEDPMKAPETLERGAGAVIPVNAGGKVMYLQPPAGNLLAQADWAQEIERMVRQDTSMPDVNFGTAKQSIVTGKAINELQGAGTGTLVEMVQGVGIGASLVSWNEKAISIGRTMFKDETMHLYGTETPSIATLNPRNFAFNLKGSELVGSTRNEVVFMPYLDMHSKVVIGLQLAGAGLVSREWQRENVGIPDSEAMDEEIISETIQDAVLALLVQTITAPEEAQQVEQQAQDYVEGGPAHPLLGMKPPQQSGGAPGGALPPGGGAPPMPGPGGGGGGGGGMPITDMAGGGQMAFPAMRMPQGAPVPGATGPSGGGAPAPPGGSEGQALVLDQVVQQFQQLQGVQGRVFLTGEIVATGSTKDTIDVAVTEPSDRDVISQSIQLPMTFHVVQGEPKEKYIEVTPGSTPTVQGETPSPEALG